MPPPTTQPRGKKAKAPASSSSSNAFITPAANSASARITQATPAMDPRLPTTPFLRSARKGECLVSENGSPVMLDSDGVHVRASSSRGTRDTIITVPLDNGKAIELSADALQNADGPSKMLSKKQKAAAKSYLTSLQEQVGALLQQLM
ncbi:uncharacterized protein MONBRDRAFT_34823 [Monosiga brevicollis MX1]|uniref:Borealin C-terminal domain-containing protein n=1 Tax=Monosiga brevicollis TaxID=81824 RepID=A9VEM0_MONBE|nr:uncharacterized protein MONBRDRAFT_34823 [Monosiga brevicollis MX1]EDQ84021.1 predicted protein [Monosiga brevicollis MX1]|eukprot:XP_001751167.1 hypothetical protein [Monosiga brevicollis MX1]